MLGYILLCVCVGGGEVPGFEWKGLNSGLLHLLGRCSTTWATCLALCTYFQSFQGYLPRSSVAPNYSVCWVSLCCLVLFPSHSSAITKRSSSSSCSPHNLFFLIYHGLKNQIVSFCEIRARRILFGVKFMNELKNILVSFYAWLCVLILSVVKWPPTIYLVSFCTWYQIPSSI
jgi:hypothetical protein